MDKHNSPPERLLILSCSKAKLPNDEPLPAIERYDGPAFRVLRKYLRQRADEHLRAHVLSAEFGLISAETLIPYYDRRLTPDRIHELQRQLTCAWNELFRQVWPGGPISERVFIHLGQDYLSCLDGQDSDWADLLEKRVAKGSQGRKLSQLHDWLYGHPPVILGRRDKKDGIHQFRGLAFRLDQASILAAGRQGLQENFAVATRIQSWSVQIDGRQVGPKWLVGQATGLAVSSFTTSDALSLLANVGIEVKRL